MIGFFYFQHLIPSSHNRPFFCLKKSQMYVLYSNYLSMVFCPTTFQAISSTSFSRPCDLSLPKIRFALSTVIWDMFPFRVIRDRPSAGSAWPGLEFGFKFYFRGLYGAPGEILLQKIKQWQSSIINTLPPQECTSPVPPSVLLQRCPSALCPADSLQHPS